MEQRTTLRPALIAGLLATSLPVGDALAAHADIEIEDIVSGQIVLHTDARPIDYATGNAIFEAEFGETTLLPHQTDDPGFATEHDVSPGPLAAGSVLNYRTLGTLSFWDGSSWSAADASTSVHVLGNLFEDSIYTGSGLLGDAVGVLGSAASDGTFHSHVDFCVENQGLAGCPDDGAEIAANSPAMGAYLIEMSIFGNDSTNTSLLYSDSDPFFIAFNNGLSEVDFEAGIDALATTAVPVPAAAWLFGSGLLGLVGVGRRRKDRA